MRRFFFGVIRFFLVASIAPTQPAQVITIRCSEKALEGNGLSLKGQKRDAALAPYFFGTEALAKYERLVAIDARFQIIAVHDPLSSLLSHWQTLFAEDSNFKRSLQCEHSGFGNAIRPWRPV